ncbi:MAG TPA: RNA methyltransferase [Bellilinea sp.]|nr:RNA methyltransferase [Bellilinea sp.]
MSQRKERRETGTFFAEGVRIVGAALEKQWQFDTIIYSPELVKADFANEIIEIARKKSIPLTEVSADVFQTLSGKDNPQGIGAVLQQQFASLEKLSQSYGNWIALFEAADPGNVGTIIRTADSAGFNGVILVGDSTDPFDPNSIRASMGSIFAIEIANITLEDLKRIRTAGRYTIIGASDKATINYRGYDYPKDLILFMGSERQGLSPAAIELCDEMVSIPMVGSADSLNLSIAGGILMYEVFNQQHETSHRRGG